MNETAARTPPPGFTIRPASQDDVPLIHAFILGLARFERLEHECLATEEALQDTLFGPRPYAEVLIGEFEGTPVGFALFFHNYSTFLAKPGIYLEDIYVDPAWRGRASERHFSSRWPIWRLPGDADALNGLSWTGTKTPSDFMSGTALY